MNIAFNGDKKSSGYLEKLMKIHGDYTEGFYENERRRFKEFIEGGRTKRHI